MKINDIFFTMYHLLSYPVEGAAKHCDTFQFSNKQRRRKVAQPRLVSLRIQQSGVPADVGGANSSSWETTGSSANESDAPGEELRSRATSVTREVSRSCHRTESWGLDCVCGVSPGQTGADIWAGPPPILGLWSRYPSDRLARDGLRSAPAPEKP